MSALLLWINLPLLTLAAVGLWAAAPVWLLLHHPRNDRGPRSRVLRDSGGRPRLLALARL